MIVNYVKAERTLKIRSIGKEHSTILFGPLDEIDRYKSLDLGWWAVDEADKMTEEMFYILMGRLRIPNVRLSGMLASNPPSTQHWLYKKFFESTEEDLALFRAKTRENQVNLPKGYIERLERSYPADWRKRYLEGEQGKLMQGSAVFPDFREDLHVKSCMHKPGRTLLRGWDFGYHHPCVVFGEFDEIGRFLVLDAVFGKDEDLDVFAPRVIQKTKLSFPQATQVQDYCDISGIQKRSMGRPDISVLNNDFRIYPSYRYSKPEERAGEIRRLMRQVPYQAAAFQIHPLNRRGIDCLIGYHYKTDDAGMPLPIPHKDDIHDNFIDAMGYILANTTMIGQNALIEENRGDMFMPMQPNHERVASRPRSRIKLWPNGRGNLH
jgi:hypothetical protein